MTILLATVLAASLIGAVSDVRTRRVPNWLVLALLICGLIENTVLFGWRGALADLAVAAAVLAAGTVAFSFKLIGGGDVKLLAAAAGTLGYPAGVSFILLTLLCGGVLALAYAALRGRLSATLANVQATALPLFAGVKPVRPHDGLVMPYAVAIFAGAICTATLSLTTLRLLP
ncbi:MAG TPA: prepilin peptidase [Candidatus Rubrimentiphilum sp.]|nr:prepilin peptidase [Candidatus Rubrimentiphilum sp.]